MDPDKLFKLINDLKEIMNADNKITKDEKNILDKVTSDVDTFKKAYKNAMDDNVITNDEYVTLAALWDKIYDESYKVAMTDNKLSDDEAAMVFKVFDALKKYS